MISITGATGHIGNVLVRKLVNSEEKIRAITAPFDNTPSLKDVDVEVIKADVTNYEQIYNALKGSDIVFHLAAIISIMPGMKQKVFNVNVNGTKNVIKACFELGISKLIYTSSVHALEEPVKGSNIDETLCFDPKKTSGIYGKSKAVAALEVQKAIKKGLNAVIICPTGVIGPYDFKLSEMGSMIFDTMNKKMKMCVNGSFDFVDVRDIVNGEIEAMKKGKNGNVYILSGHKINFYDLVNEIKKIENLDYKTVFLPKSLTNIISWFSPFYYKLFKKIPRFTPYTMHTISRNYTFSFENAKNELNYFPQPLEKTLKDTIDWFKKNYNT
ncbi:dihydroflavonol-4-reductase [Tepiditoga spiralis]|uniref:Dihydroflavonol-4-reductase n=1 Tax=Tepiditoga spiralis TaxID=2108365 RepID=A0A7G1G4A9_9BACT|nr:NAD-dependent epimerase/dehydratase family protein [Tepiditoga spiralis]BBE31328.1 dihydroflavonol-4-reductase [Tepiditoga spiralis]